ncbi:Uncharacterised protein [Klebsiella aerogenes]|nr:Uncharacterised protein [Klebsiella aerogenes]
MGINVGKEAVFVRRRQIPGGRRLLARQLNADDGFNAFKTVLPRHGQADRRAVLRRQRFAIHADGKQRQGVHGFVKPQPFHVRISKSPADKTIFLPGHLIRGVKGFEGDIARVAGGFHQRQQFMQRETDPGNDHRPGLHAAHTVNALLQRKAFGQIVMVKGQRLRHFTGRWSVSRDRCAGYLRSPPGRLYRGRIHKSYCNRRPYLPG